ncbi:hypothetical protein FUAX_49010 (plasmid) [Fulvitalea axinellae]|uniref:DUF1835 domain-containing protein n=2 Tax=Fulvitalea axinellae TaxID=1182444 RepID=A0AAU9DDC3_9BACT|nr:hypothetical protein FUAX_49010 [Fulvitalea axinellae]
MNGDSSAILLKSQSISGDVVVWREMLAEGRVCPEVGSTDFWNIRFDEFSRRFNVDEAAYRKGVISQFAEAQHFPEYDEVVLWFEYDLFCQINLIASLSWLWRQGIFEYSQVYLICVGKFPGKQKLFGLGELPATTYPGLYRDRQKVTEETCFDADRAWQAYAGTDPRVLESEAITEHKGLPYLSEAIKAHLKRFPDSQTGLNVIEQSLLSIIENGYDTPQKAVGAILRSQGVYGFGDTQYETYIKELAPLLDKGPVLRLNELGRNALLGQANVSSEIGLENRYLGGALAGSYRWDNDKNRLIIAQN